MWGSVRPIVLGIVTSLLERTEFTACSASHAETLLLLLLVLASFCISIFVLATFLATSFSALLFSSLLAFVALFSFLTSASSTHLPFPSDPCARASRSPCLLACNCNSAGVMVSSSGVRISRCLDTLQPSLTAFSTAINLAARASRAIVLLSPDPSPLQETVREGQGCRGRRAICQ